MGSTLWAKEDGIEIRNGRFIIPCSKCGGEVSRTSYSRKLTYICKHCKKAIDAKKKLEKRMQDPRTDGEIRFDTAVERLKEQGIDDSWNSAIKVAKKRTYEYGSVPEVMLAIALLHNKYSIIPQQRIGRYKVDFVIPKHQLIIEVDGEAYHYNKEKERKREGDIQLIMGFTWKILHIPVMFIEMDAQKVVDRFVSQYLLSKQPYSGDNNL